ncbi:MAG: Hpt domain-containing protein [Treponema sp.]|jgi:HPt (histidine-containing phosphotransfer) domain-containing protein|nr:Hpt domain-containing protein [Treponema sp.]
MADEVIYVDFGEGVKRVMNNAKLYVKLLTKFKNDTRLDDLAAALGAANLEQAKSEAHKIKGLAANLSLTELYKQSLELETQIKAGAVEPGQLETVQAAFTQTVQEIEKVIAQNG